MPLVVLDYSHSHLDWSEKVARIKQAREEAYKEVKQYEDQLKDQLKSAEAGGAVQGDKSSKLAQETEQQLMEIRKSAEVTPICLMWEWPGAVRLVGRRSQRRFIMFRECQFFRDDGDSAARPHSRAACTPARLDC